MTSRAEILLLISILISGLPLVLVFSTAYLKVNIVFNIFKNALGVQQVPSGLILAVLSFALSMLIMQPIWNAISVKLPTELPTNFNRLDQTWKSLRIIIDPWQEFITRHADLKTVEFLKNLQKTGLQNGEHPPSIFIIITAFVISELKEAFMIGCYIMIPFILIDFVIANLLTGLGLMMLSPLLISMPVKILLVVQFNIWELIFQSLYLSYV